MKQYTIFVLIIITIFSCNNSSPDKNRIPLAKVYDKYLYADDLEGIIPEGTNAQDSISIIKSNIDLWIKKQLLLNKAEINMKADEKEINKKIEDYRASLLIYDYKQEFLKQKLDTIVANEDISAYYKSNSESFKLNNAVVKALLIAVSKKNTDINSLNHMFFSTKQDSVKIVEFCKKSESKYEFFKNQWVLFSNFSGMLPINTDNPEIILKSGNKFQYQDQNYYYFLKINDYRLRGETQPLQFVKDQIKSIILNKRKVELIDELEQNIYQNALEYKNFEIFKH
jgi:hypothetical protein